MNANSPPQTLPLAGTMVVSLEHAVAAPFATRQLADLGARVIKIERPGSGDFARSYDAAVNGLSAYFVWLNRNKESVTCDLKDEAERDFLERLIARADIFVQNLAPGSASRLGLDASTLVERFPRLIACDISGYGAGGPLASKKAYDLLIQNEAGLLTMTGTPSAPCRAGISIADIAGGMYSYTGVLTALYERELTGFGTALEVSLFDAMAEWMLQPFYSASYGGTPERSGSHHSVIAPYGPVRTSDGASVTFAIQSEGEWLAFCSGVLQQPGAAADERFASNELRVSNRVALWEMIVEAVSDLDETELIRRLERAKIAYAFQRPPQDLADHPQMVSRGRWKSVETPVGPIPSLMPPVTIAGRDSRMDPVPALGEHNDSVRAWLEQLDRAEGARV